MPTDLHPPRATKLWPLLLALLALVTHPSAAQWPATSEPGQRLRPAALPPGGLVPYRKGTLWGYADTTGRVVISPRFPYQAPAFNFGRKFILTYSNTWAGEYRQGSYRQGTLAVNARGEVLSADPEHALVLLPDSSLTLAPLGEKGVRYVQLDRNGYSILPEPAAKPPLPAGELPYLPREGFERDGRYGPLGFSRQIRQKNLWPVPYFNSHFELKLGYPEGPKALANARNRRLTGYHYGQLFPFHDGLALANRRGKHGYLDVRGRQVIKPQFGFGSEDFYKQRAVVTDASGNQALIDTKGRFVIPFAPGQQLRHPPLAGRGSAGVPLLVRLRYPRPNQPPDTVAFYTYDGHPAFPGLYFTDALPFELGRAWVKCGDKVGLIDEQGKAVLPCRYDELVFERIDEHPNFWNDYRGGSTMAAASLAALRPPHMNLPIDTLHLRFRLNGRYGYLRRATGQEIIPARYDSVQHGLHRSFAFLRRDGQVYMVDRQGRELVTGAFKQEFRRGGQRFFRLSRPGEWCVVDTSGQQRLPWQPEANQLVEFALATGVAIVRQPFEKGSGHWRYSAVGPKGLLTKGEFSKMVFWGPEEILCERANNRDAPAKPSYLLYDHSGRLGLTLHYQALALIAGTELAVLLRYDDLTAGTLVIDTKTGGVLHRLPSTWSVAAVGLTNEDGRPFTSEMSFDPPVSLANCAFGRWAGLLQVTENAHTPNAKDLGVLNRQGHRFWEE